MIKWNSNLADSEHGFGWECSVLPRVPERVNGLEMRNCGWCLRLFREALQPGMKLFAKWRGNGLSGNRIFLVKTRLTITE